MTEPVEVGILFDVTAFADPKEQSDVLEAVDDVLDDELLGSVTLDGQRWHVVYDQLDDAEARLQSLLERVIERVPNAELSRPFSPLDAEVVYAAERVGIATKAGFQMVVDGEAPDWVRKWEVSQQ